MKQLYLKQHLTWQVKKILYSVIGDICYVFCGAVPRGMLPIQPSRLSLTAIPHVVTRALVLDCDTLPVEKTTAPSSLPVILPLLKLP